MEAQFAAAGKFHSALSPSFSMMLRHRLNFFFQNEIWLTLDQSSSCGQLQSYTNGYANERLSGEERFGGILPKAITQK
jgi:hypothetical protein